MQLENDLEPFFSLEVTAELCGCTVYALEHFLRKYADRFPKQYHHDGFSSGRGKIVLFRSQIVEIRKMMLSGEIQWRDRAKGRGRNEDGRKTNIDLGKLRRSHYFEKPPAHWLLNND